MSCDLYNAAKALAVQRGLSMPEQCDKEIDCSGVSCSKGHLGMMGGDGRSNDAVMSAEGRVIRRRFEARVAKSVIMQAQRGG